MLPFFDSCTWRLPHSVSSLPLYIVPPIFWMWLQVVFGVVGFTDVVKIVELASGVSLLSSDVSREWKSSSPTRSTKLMNKFLLSTYDCLCRTGTDRAKRVPAHISFYSIISLIGLTSVSLLRVEQKYPEKWTGLYSQPAIAPENICKTSPENCIYVRVIFKQPLPAFFYLLLVRNSFRSPGTTFLSVLSENCCLAK